MAKYEVLNSLLTDARGENHLAGAIIDGEALGNLLARYLDLGAVKKVEDATKQVSDTAPLAEPPKKARK